jgi:mercuric ion transport protein
MTNTYIRKSWIPALIAAFAASLCCITPIVALLGGIGGIASSFSWIEPARPYLVGFTVLIFAFAWYQQFNKKAQTNDCCDVKPVSFWQSKKFLLIVTVLSAMLITFPYYSSALYGAPKQSSVITMRKSNLKWVQFSVGGMGCADCTKHIDGVLSKVTGVVKVSTSFEKAQTSVTYDPKKTSADSLKNKINQIGY